MKTEFKENHGNSVQTESEDERGNRLPYRREKSFRKGETETNRKEMKDDSHVVFILQWECK